MYPVPTTWAGYCSILPAPGNASSGAGDGTIRPWKQGSFSEAGGAVSRPWRCDFQGRLVPSAAPGNAACFQGRVVPSPAPENAFPGASENLQYPAPVVGAGYICTRPKKKTGVSRNHFCSSEFFPLIWYDPKKCHTTKQNKNFNITVDLKQGRF